MATPCPHDPTLRVPLESGQDLARARFLEEIAARGLIHLGHDHFPAELDAATAAALGEPVLVRASADGDEVEALVRTAAGALVYADYGYGSLDVEVAAPARDTVVAELARLRGALAAPEPEQDEVPMRFWAAWDGRNREVRAGAWGDLRGNYAAPTAAALDALVELEAPERGRLLLWHGAPGTGKTHALRALARAWRPWCSTHCVLDPAVLLGADPRYLLKVLDWDEDDDRWRLLVLEDAGALARHDAGGAMAQLLNLTDGLLGESARVLTLITTNEPAATLSPALRRPGRCLAEVEFAPLSAVEASRWLGAELERAHTLSELFALRDGVEESPATRPAFGFGRAILSEALKPDLERVISS